MKKYFYNAGWLVLEKIFRLATNFIFLGMIANKIGPSDFGVITFSQSIVIMLLAVTNLGMDGLLVNEFSKSVEKKYSNSVLFNTAFFSKLGISGLILAFFCFYSLIFSNSSFSDETLSIFYITLISLVFYCQSVYVAYFQAISKSKLISYASIFSLLVSSIVKVLLLVNSSNSVYYAASFTFDLIILLLSSVYVARKYNDLSLDFKKINRTCFNYIFSKSYPLMFSAILLVIYSRLDQLMIAGMLGTEDLGLYGVAIRISDAYIFIPSMIASSFFPLISVDNSKENVIFYFSIVFLAAVISCAFVLLLGPILIPVLFGAQFVESISAMNIVVLSSVFAVVGSAATNYLITVNLTYIRLIRVFVGLIINVVLNFLWIPEYGIVGAAYATLITQIVAAWASNYFNVKSRECFYWQTYSILTLGIASVSYFHKRRKQESE